MDLAVVNVYEENDDKEIQFTINTIGEKYVMITITIHSKLMMKSLQPSRLTVISLFLSMTKILQNYFLT